MARTYREEIDYILGNDKNYTFDEATDYTALMQAALADNANTADLDVLNIARDNKRRAGAAKGIVYTNADGTLTTSYDTTDYNKSLNATRGNVAEELIEAPTTGISVEEYAAVPTINKTAVYDYVRQLAPPLPNTQSGNDLYKQLTLFARSNSVGQGNQITSALYPLKLIDQK